MKDGWQGLPAQGTAPDCNPCCSSCRSRTSQQHLTAQPGMGATLGTPRTGNMVFSLVQALITSQSLAVAPTASPGLVHHTQTSAEPRAAAHPFSSLAGVCFDLSHSFPPSPSPPSPKMFPGTEDPCRSPVFVASLSWFMSRPQWGLEVGAAASSRIRLKKMSLLCFLSPPQLNWIHTVLSFICQGSKLELNIALRAGRARHNGAAKGLNGSAFPGSELSSAFVCVCDCMWAWK